MSKHYDHKQAIDRLLLPTVATRDDRASQSAPSVGNPHVEGAVLPAHTAPLTRRTDRMRAAGLTPREILRRRQEEYKLRNPARTTVGGTECNYPRYIGQRGLGALQIQDTRDRYFNVIPLLASVDERTSRYYAIPDECLIDNGPYPYSPAYAFRLWLSCSPLRTANGPSAFDIYEQARWKLTDVQREAYTDGVTLRSVGIAMRDAGIIDGFYWSTHVDEIRHWLLYNGSPVIVTTVWYEGMEVAHGRVALPVGKRLGMNSYLVTGWDDTQDSARIVTSRGPLWGRRGTKWLMRKDLQNLLDVGGECFIPIGKRIGKAARARRQELTEKGKGYKFVLRSNRAILVSDKLGAVDLQTLPADRAVRTAADERRALIEHDEWDSWDHMDIGE